MVTTKRTTAYLRGLLKKDQSLEQMGISGRDACFPVLPGESAQLLKLLITLAKPKKILEIGTNIGYSAGIMLSAAPQARLYTIEMEEDTAHRAEENFKQAGFSERATIYIGKAEEILSYMTGSYDFIFLDGPKGHYLLLLDYLLPLLADDGVLVCDNVLFRGMVTGDRKPKRRKETICKKLDLFLKEISNNPQLITSVLPIGDGMSVSYKKIPSESFVFKTSGFCVPFG